MVQASPTARLIMTTREHILRQAVITSEKLRHSRLIDSRCVLEIGDYSQEQRAQILYNHIYFSELPDEYRSALMAGRFYREIILHRKFNPRLIDWLSSYQRIKKSVPVTRYQHFVRELLSNPAEIWTYAYENQVSDAARSVLLALFTFRGKCRPSLLKPAFLSLHEFRSKRYGFKTAPSDWHRALGELNGSFIRPGDEIDVIDPSVLDMLNAVVRRDSLNALDMLDGAVRFAQARQIWTFAIAQGNGNVLSELAADPTRVAAAFQRLLSAPRKYGTGTGAVVHFDDNQELRIGTMTDMAQVLRSEQLARIATSTIIALIADWENAPIDVADGAALLQKLKTCTLYASLCSAAVRAQIVRALVMEVSTGCRSDEFRALLDAVEPGELDVELTRHLQAGAHIYRAHHFSGELQECRSADAFDALKADIEAINARTNLDFEGPIDAIREAKDEFERYESAYEDQQYEQWKENRYEERMGNQAIDDLFDSLKKA
jgi:hypothetical protein